MIPAVLLTGTIGAGKTTLAELISERLHAAGHVHALLELDALGGLYPPPNPTEPYSLDLGIDNLRAVWPNFVARGVRCAVLTGTITNARELDQVRLALPDARIMPVLVTAEAELVHARLRAREKGSLLGPFLERTDRLAIETEAAVPDAPKVMNDGTPTDAASEVLALLGWIPTGS